MVAAAVLTATGPAGVTILLAEVAAAADGGDEKAAVKDEEVADEIRVVIFPCIAG